MKKIKKILMLIILYVISFSGCAEEFDKDNLTLNQCRTYINELKAFLDNNIEPMVTLSDAEVSKLPSMINASIINDIDNYNDIFGECQFVKMRDKANKKTDNGKEYEYSEIYSSLVSISAYMNNIKEKAAAGDEFLKLLSGYLKKNYIKLTNVL